jgi:hypothetical protein
LPRVVDVLQNPEGNERGKAVTIVTQEEIQETVTKPPSDTRAVVSSSVLATPTNAIALLDWDFMQYVTNYGTRYARFQRRPLHPYTAA